jgi:hypothetical protein
MKIKCNKCKTKIAIWFYEGKADTAYCDDCVSRLGCSCNEINGVLDKDELGRALPCVDFMLYEEGRLFALYEEDREYDIVEISKKLGAKEIINVSDFKGDSVNKSRMMYEAMNSRK